jgi:ATP-dependent DNA helicase RecG
MVDYLKKRGIDKDYCQKMVVDLLQMQGEASRSEIESLLLTKLSDALHDDQKKNFIQNLLQAMRRDGFLVVEGTTRWAKWRLGAEQ